MVCRNTLWLEVKWKKIVLSPLVFVLFYFDWDKKTAVKMHFYKSHANFKLIRFSTTLARICREAPALDECKFRASMPGRRRRILLLLLYYYCHFTRDYISILERKTSPEHWDNSLWWSTTRYTSNELILNVCCSVWISQYLWIVLEVQCT